MLDRSQPRKLFGLDEATHQIREQYRILQVLPQQVDLGIRKQHAHPLQKKKI
jgi:hypothetical protein